MLRRFWLVLLGLLLLFAWPRSVLAHPEIIETEPPANAELRTPPSQIRISFNEPLEAAFSQIQLYDAQGIQVDAGGSGLDPQAPNEILLDVPAIGPGLYTVVWQTVGSDGHKVIGSFLFTVLGDSVQPGTPTVTPLAAPVATPTPVASLPSQSADSVPPSLIILLRTLMFIGALVVSGGWLVIACVLLPALPQGFLPAHTALHKRWRRIAVQNLLLLMSAVVVFMLVQTVLLAGQIDLESLSRFSIETRQGIALLSRIGLALGLGILLFTPFMLQRWPAILALVIGAGLLASFSLAGHAAAQAQPWLPVLADWVHLAAAAIWLGGLVVLVFVAPSSLGTLQTKERTSALAAIIVRFSNLALASVIALTISGTYAALLHLHALSDLWTSSYGLALLVKLLAFGGLIALGAHNLWLVRPRFVAWAEQLAQTAIMKQWQRRFQWAMRGELLLVICALGGAGVLTNSAPPSGSPGSNSAQPPVIIQMVTPVVRTPQPSPTSVPSEPFAETRQVDNLNIELKVEPAAIGENMLRVTLRDQQGVPTDIQRVELTLQMISMDMGVNKLEVLERGNGIYEAPQSWLSMVGEWKITVTIRRSDADDLHLDYIVPVGG